MEYVMVPVPEEHVVDVMVYIARLTARTSVEPWTSDAVEEFFDEIDEASRSLVSIVARATVTDKELSDEDAATALELSPREIRAILREINELARREKREPLLAIREATVVLRNGRSVVKRLFSMNDPVARMVRSHERASVDATAPVSSSE
jgi:hypothetical protein